MQNLEPRSLLSLNMLTLDRKSNMVVGLTAALYVLGCIILPLWVSTMQIDVDAVSGLLLDTIPLGASEAQELESYLNVVSEFILKMITAAGSAVGVYHLWKKAKAYKPRRRTTKK